MHIGLYSPVWPPGAVSNGIATYVLIVKDELIRRGHRVAIFSGACEPEPGQGVHQVRGPHRSRLWRALRHRLGFLRPSIADFGPTIARAVSRVHAADPIDVFEMEESFGWCGSIAQHTDIPLVVKLHGPAFLSLIDSEQHSSERLQRIHSEGRALGLARMIVAPSQSTLRETALKYQLDRSRLVSLPNPVDDVSHELRWSADKRLPDELLFVGRFDYRKGGDAVLLAFARLAESRPRLRLTFVGPDTGLSLGPGRQQGIVDYMAAHLAPEVAARVRFLGSRSIDEVQRLRAASAVTLVATRWESFGYAVAEAMVQACPVVAFDVAGVNELIVDRESGLLAPLDDVAAFAEMAGLLLDQPELASRLGARARASVLQSCGAPAVVDRMLELYEQLKQQAALPSRTACSADVPTGPSPNGNKR